MDVTNERFLLAHKSLDRLKSTLEKLKTNAYKAEFEEMRDAAIQRFEFSLDTFWKFMHAYLQEIELINIQGAPSPRSAFRHALHMTLITPDEYKKCIDMVEDRNRTSHTYNEQTAQDIFERLPNYHLLLDELLKRLKSKL